jgi:hypothetical protein
MAISARNFSNSASSSSSSGCLDLPLTMYKSPSQWIGQTKDRLRIDSRSPFAVAGNRLSRSATGTVPVLSICSSIASCSRSSNSAVNSSSSACSPMGLFVMAVAISSASCCCSRNLSLTVQCQTSSIYGKLKHCHIHHRVDLVHGEAIMHALHGTARLVHRVQRLLVDVGRFDRINLLL